MDSDYVLNMVGGTIVITAIIIFGCCCFIDWKYSEYWKGELCVENYQYYSDVVKCKEELKNKSSYQTVKYFMKLERDKIDVGKNVENQ